MISRYVKMVTKSLKEKNTKKKIHVEENLLRTEQRAAYGMTGNWGKIFATGFRT